jgi:hypothetical protein
MRSLCFFTLLAALWPWGLILAQEEPSGPDEVPFIQQTLERSTEFYGSGMRALVEDVAKTVNLDADATAQLNAAAEAAVKEKMDKSRTGLWKTWKEMAVDGRVNQNSFWISYRKLPEAILTPDRSTFWAEGLKKSLTVEQAKVWSQEEQKRRDRVDKAIQDYLTKGREDWRTKRLEVRKLDVAELVKTVPLDTATADKLTAGLAGVIAEGAKSWGSSLEKQLREYVKSAFLGGAEERVAAIEAGNINFGTMTDSTAQELEDTAWKALVSNTVPKTLVAGIQAKEQLRNQKRNLAVAMMTTAELDRKVRLTAEQRSKLEPLFLKTVQSHRAKVDMLLSQNYVNTEMLLMLLNGIAEAEVKDVLEPDQLRGWREAMQVYADWWNSF